MNIMERLVGQPLAIRPESLSALLRVDALAPAPQASRFVGARASGGVARVTPNGVAVVTLDGVMINRGQIIGENWGVNSFEGIAYKLQALAGDRKVKSILLDFESPGGEAIGAFETAALIRKIGATKPVYAICNGVMCSAAYALATAARAIITTPSGIVGSIGVIAIHMDFSRALDKAGVTPSLIFAGERKTDGSPYQPLSDTAKTGLQEEVDGLYSQFLETVAAGRGARLTAAAAKATQAQTYIGADAKAAGLADEVSTFDEVLEYLERRAA